MDQIPDTVEPISLRAYAKSRQARGLPGNSPMAVSNAVKFGRLVKCVVRDRHDQPKISSVELADQEWEANTDSVKRENAAGSIPVLTNSPKPRPVGKGATEFKTLDDELPVPDMDNPPEPVIEKDPENGHETVASATQREKHWKANLAELNFREAAKELVPAIDVERRLIAVFTSCKSRLLAIPSRALQALPHLVAADLLVLEELVREACEDLSEGKTT